MLRKLRLALATGLLGVSAVTGTGAWANPDRAPAVPPALVNQEAPLRPTSMRDYFSPTVDVLILVALVGWLAMMLRRRRREARVLDFDVSERLPAARGSLRTVTSPTGVHSELLRQYRAQWIEEFKSLQDAWAQHDLRPVSGIIDADIRDELERHPAAADVSLPQVLIAQADPADSWEESGKEFVTVHFSGKLLEPGAKAAQEFDEYWTFFRKPGGSEAVASDPWVVASIRRGNRERSLPRLAHRG